MWSMSDLLDKMKEEGIPTSCMSDKHMARMIEIIEDLIIARNPPELIKEHLPGLALRRFGDAE